DTQATLVDGKLNVSGVDRVAFDGRLRSLDRLGESTIENQSNEFRLRSRTLDMQQALSTLSASGYIDRNTAAGTGAPAQAAAAASAKTDKNGKTTVTTDTPKAPGPAVTVLSSNGSTPAAATSPPVVVNASNGNNV